jgi:hypothetical protein
MGENTAGWANVSGCDNPMSEPVKPAEQIANAANGPCPAPSLKKGDYIGTQGGAVTPAMEAIAVNFGKKFDESDTIVVDDPVIDGPSYEGKGWSVVVPVVSWTDSTSGCPTGSAAQVPFGSAIFAKALGFGARCGSLFVGTAFAGNQVNQNREIVGFTRFVITQVIFKGECVRENTADVGNKPFWPKSGDNGIACGPDGNPKGTGALNEVYGYYSCELFHTPGDAAGPPSSRGKPKLVQ